MASFFSLPRELRDQIYISYVSTENGYYFDSVTERLRDSGGSPLDLALMYTCKAIAAEMEGIALRQNSITFTTFRGQSDVAERFDRYVREREEALDAMLTYTASSHVCITENILEALQHRYPANSTIGTLLSMTEEERYERLGNSMFARPCNGEPASVSRQLLRDMLLAVDSPVFQQTTAVDYNGPEPDRGIRHYSAGSQTSLIEMDPVLWAVPSDQDLSSLRNLLTNTTQDDNSPVRIWRHNRERSHEGRRLKFYFSAATAAIQFLAELPTSARKHVRRIIVEEDHRAVALPESHAQGFARFWKENPKLRIERRVNLCEAVLFTDQYHGYALVHVERTQDNVKCDISGAVDTMRYWIDEAMALERYHGVSKTAFSLTFKAPPGIRQQIWDAMKLTAAVQEAGEELCRRGRLEERFEWTGSRDRQYLKRPPQYISIEFPVAIREMIEGTSHIHLDADKGGLWDVDEVIAEYPDLGDPFFDPIDDDHCNLDDEELDGGWFGIFAKYVELREIIVGREE